MSIRSRRRWVYPSAPKSLLALSVIAALVSVSSLSYAATSSASSLGASSNVLSAPLPKKKPLLKPKVRSYDLSLSVGQEGYVSRTPELTGTTAYTELGARLRANTDSLPVSAAIEIAGSLATEVENYTNFEVPEAYASMTSVDKSEPDYYAGKSYARADVGRKKERWSALDSDWALGLFQPMNKFNALRPTEQGLTGGFFKAGRGSVNVTVFGSAVFIPEQGPNFKNENGRFDTTNPWFSPPPDSLILNIGSSPVRSPVNYTLNLPETRSVVFNESAGGMIRISNPDEPYGFFAQASTLRKPQNALSLGFTGKLTLTDDDSYGDVVVYPEVVYHTVSAVDLGYDSKAVSVGFSVVHEKPDQAPTSTDLTSQKTQPMTLFSPSVELRPFASSFWAPRVRLSYLDTNGGEVSAVGKFASNGNVFGPRVMYRRAVSASVNSQIYRTNRLRLEAGTRWIEELDERGSILMTDVSLAVGSSWLVAIQADVLGSKQPVSFSDTFIARYRANDRLAARVTYLF